MTEDPSSPPIEMFYADALLTDKDLDIAVLKISTDMNMKPVNWNAVKLPKASLGDSDSLQLGDPIMILGYPAIGGQTITLTTGNVGGFSSQKSYGDRAYIKTAATISGGTSGGMALDEMGQMVAIPTQLGNGDNEEVVDCRVIADTNGDGNVNQRDACVPVGGFINALRPVNLAYEIIKSAKRITGSAE